MVTTYGNASRAITGGAGLDIPLEPAAVSAHQAELRRQRQIAAIEAAEAAATRAAQQTPLPHRRRRAAQTVSLPVSVPRPAPAPEPEVLIEQVEPTTPETPVAAKPEVTTGFGTNAPAQVRQLKAELAMAGQRISALLAQVEEQGACIAGALVDLQTATSMATQLSELATEQQDLLRSRAETAERDLIAAHRQIDSLIAELATAATTHDNDQVVCLGTGCNLPVDPKYVARTGFLWHGPCKDRVPSAAVRFSGRRVA
jgi:hypothetical protein